MRFSLDENGIRTYIDDAIPGQDYYCPECGEKMVQRHGEILAHCFAHYPNTQCTDAWRYDESEWHMAFQSLFPKENQEIVKKLNERKHRADVLYEDRKVVIELQGERLRQDEFDQRNKFFNALGYKVIWIFEQSRIFDNESINYGYRRMGCTRTWERPSRTFGGFYPQERKDEVEVWFQRSRSKNPDQPRFFQILESVNGFKRIDCGFCYSLKELLKYLRTGRRTPDYSKLYDIKYGVCDKNEEIVIPSCPKKPSERWPNSAICSDCIFRVRMDGPDMPWRSGCSYRFEHINWSKEGEISNINRREDGLIDSLTFTESSGEVTNIPLSTEKSFLRTLNDLWEQYKPLKYIIAYNCKNHTVYSVFNPGWQKYKNGVVKGKIVGYKHSLSRGEIEIPNPEETVWFAVNFLKVS